MKNRFVVIKNPNSGELSRPWITVDRMGTFFNKYFNTRKEARESAKKANILWTKFYS